MTVLSTDAAITRFGTNEDLINTFVNDPLSAGSYPTNTTPSVNVQTLPAFISSNQALVNSAILSLATPNIRGAWAAATAYAIKDVVSSSGTYYVCLLAHTSGGSFPGVGADWSVYQGTNGASIGKNVIVNGDCSIAQVNGASAVTSVSGTWPIDMLYFGCSVASKLQVQQVSSTLNSLGATTSATWSVLSSYTPLAADYFYGSYRVEGFNFARFQYGTANAKAGSLQFKARASIAGTYSGSLQNASTNRSYPFTFVLAANTDTLIQIPNIPGDTAGTWVGATNASSLSLNFCLGVGTTYAGAAGSWQGANYVGVTGATNLVTQTNGSTLSITDVQFEVGSVCTQFERKLYDQNLRECQRYLRDAFAYSSTGQCVTTTQACILTFGVPMRVTPSITVSGTLTIGAANMSSVTVTGTGILGMSNDGGISWYANTGSGLVAGNATQLIGGGGAYFGAQI